MTLKGRAALVTGVSREAGIGTAICRALAEGGADLFYTHWRAYDAEEGCGLQEGWPDRLQQELEGIGVRAGQMEADFMDPDVPLQVLDEAERALGRLPSIIIHNACYCAPTSYRTLTQESLDRHYIVNNRAPALLSMEFARRFEQAHQAGGAGRILFLLSKGPDADNLAYLATKQLLAGLIEPLAAGLAPLGITVNGLDPGPTDSGWMSDELKRQLLPLFPMGRIGQPEDAARALAFLASDEAQWITGQSIRSEGGFLGR
ncbi:SDR family oxidoreductase [Paenibacillus pasadenensis]|uniref:3-oxoacyl-[acyl-carrier protein] reductase-like n=1 Tax=Paenibacillus pasadenensis TaxID=217090 RepID=A0A2N5N0W3_9BACL|nr:MULTISPECIES: SDR family oxidoreductase [Paenibacillus]PLT43966.1 3-oxoacyl-[acyl-carrier protein] reductase-like [Paenibacillus pasadenensis]QGG54530.1 SDR family oxidoreductase [Paenibacillus sp. B01]